MQFAEGGERGFGTNSKLIAVKAGMGVWKKQKGVLQWT